MTATHQGIKLTPRAARHALDFLAREGSTALRFGVRRTGCSGWAYVVEGASEATEQDVVFEDHGVRVLVDGAVLPMLDGTTIDYVQQGLNWMLVFDNPNVADRCGCGESFAFTDSVASSPPGG